MYSDSATGFMLGLHNTFSVYIVNTLIRPSAAQLLSKYRYRQNAPSPGSELYRVLHESELYRVLHKVGADQGAGNVGIFSGLAREAEIEGGGEGGRGVGAGVSGGAR